MRRYRQSLKMALAAACLLLCCLPLTAATNGAGSTESADPQSEDAPRMVLESGGHMAVIRVLLFSADGRELISAGDDKTIRVWSVSPDGRTADLKRTIRGQAGTGRAGQIFAGALSPPDSEGRQRWLAVGGYLAGAEDARNAIRLHDYATGDIRVLLKGHTDNVLALAFSPNGRWLASAGKDRTIRVWDLSTLQGGRLSKPPVLLSHHTDRITGLAWSTTGDRLASASYDGTVGLWDTSLIPYQRPALVTQLKGHTGKVRSVAFHPKGPLLATGGQDRTIRLWQARDGKSLGTLATATHALSALAFSPNGRFIVAGNFTPPKPDHLTLFTYPEGEPHIQFKGHDNLVIATAFHPGGAWLASAGGDHKEILLWRPENGEILSRLSGRGRTIYAVAFSKDGRFISWGQTSQFVSVNDRGPLEQHFDLLDQRRIYGGLNPSEAVRAVTAVNQISLHVSGDGDASLDVKKGWKRLCTINRDAADGFWHSAFTLSPDGQSILSGGQNGALRLYAVDGALRARLVGHTGQIKAVAISPDGRWALSGANDQTLCLWDLAPVQLSGEEQISPAMTLFPAANGEWIAWTPQGYFAASTWGSHLVGYRVNRGLSKVAEFVSIDQLYDRFYRPDLVQAKLFDDPQKLWQQKSASADAKDVVAEGLAPRVAFIDPIADDAVGQQAVSVHANIMDQGGGIGKVIWRVNGTTVATESDFKRPAVRLANADTAAQQPGVVTLEQNFTLLPGDNRIELLAYNQQNEIASSPAVLELMVRPPEEAPPATSIETTPPGAGKKDAAPQRPALHLMVVGVDNYRDRALRLKYAVQDGRAIADIIRQTGASLFKDVNVTLLFDEQVTVAGLKQTFHDVRTAILPQDVFMFYLAGHGVTRDGRYYFLPYDFRYVNDEAIVLSAVNQDHLQEWLSLIPARKSLVLIDTCESGSFTNSMVAMRGMAQKTAIAKLTRATGRATIVASTDEQPAYEGYQGHGVFTYVLLEGLRHADTSFGNRDGYTGLFELAAYVNDQVPTITMNAFNFEQIPQVHMVGTDFPIGVVRTDGS